MHQREGQRRMILYDLIMWFISCITMISLRWEARSNTIFYHTTCLITVTKFLYPDLYSNHYCYQDSMYNNNIRRMYPTSIEQQMRTHTWPNWVFQLLIGVAELNFNITNHHIYKQNLMDEVTFWWGLSVELINKPYLNITIDIEPKYVLLQNNWLNISLWC